MLDGGGVVLRPGFPGIAACASWKTVCLMVAEIAPQSTGSSVDLATGSSIFRDLAVWSRKINNA